LNRIHTVGRRFDGSKNLVKFSLNFDPASESAVDVYADARAATIRIAAARCGRHTRRRPVVAPAFASPGGRE
jgi:hypothetical protein